MWLRKCCIDENAIVSTAQYLCSKHFKEDDYNVGDVRRRLKRNVVPSIFLVNHSNVSVSMHSAKE